MTATDTAKSRNALVGTVKVPRRITALFWAIKIMSTGMGEAAADYLSHKNVGLAIVVGTAGLALGLLFQFRANEYKPSRYWFAVAMVAVFGTLAADAVHKELNLPFQVTSILYGCAVAVIFGAWYVTERTLSIHSINTRRREAFYWMTVLATFALGTAVGDLTAFSFGWGYLTSALVFAGLIAIPALAWRVFNLNAVLAFWAAYVLTRPLGASLADWTAAPGFLGGLNFGFGRTAVVSGLVIAVLVAYSSVRRVENSGAQRD